MSNIYQRVMKYNQNRVPGFLPLKFKLMASGAFRFYRGSCHLFYEDLLQKQTWTDATKAWICGDLHVENFGTYRSRNKVVYFDLNDFDEAVLAHPTWEFVRFITSVFLAGKELKFKDEELKNITEILSNEYINTLKSGKAYSIEKETIQGVLKKYIKTLEARNELDFLNSKSILKSNKKREFIIDNKRYFPIDDKTLKKALIADFSAYLNTLVSDKQAEFEVQDAAIRVAGTGSIGLKRYVFLVYQSATRDFYLFDVKQAQPSSLSLTPFLKIEQPEWKNQAERIQTIQYYMEYVTPGWLSRIDLDNESFIVKELQPEQDKMDFSLCMGKPKKFTDACHYMARLIAYAQLRSASRQGADNIDGLIKFAENAVQWKAELLDYAYNYYQQVLRDYAEFSEAYHAVNIEK
ncbi:DUF2252 domain-containing protein [Acinetobacter stercoris]|uniref:DUF2252 domain-containing protein n=1 Tax=Acinetobacter stercoris TaxID=2126983 RepID=A0A2U3N221_9GAMM|nr:DUF2252 family protein [Acinetobacter stercoris]SPL71683.1 hypothetical protein KPC_2861 [Acinetobacter stercoris]